MGASKNYQRAPAWQGRNTPGGSTTPSKGPVIKPEGTQVSKSYSGNPHNKAGKKTKTRQVQVKNPGPMGYS
jgi:hypothetical protein